MNMTDGKPNNTEPPIDPKSDPVDDTIEKFSEIKNKYETTIQEKDKEIEELKKKLQAKDSEVNDTIQSLNDEVNEKLAQAEELKKLQESVNDLLHDKAEATVDKYIREGKIAPAQKEKALQLCLSDQDMFISLYEDAPSIVDTTPKPRSTRVNGDVEKMAAYFKN